MSQNSPAVTDLTVPDNLFKEVKYYLIGNIDEKISKYLNDGGAKQDSYLSEMVTHVIAEDDSDDDFNEAKELFELPVVTSQWVVLSVKCGCLLPTNAFSPESTQIFSGVVACPSQMEEADCNVLWAMITFHGGKCQLELNKKCTHLIVTKPAGAKYDCAMKHPEKITIITPDWVTECVKEKTKVDAAYYHPKLLISDEPEPEPEESPPPAEPETQQEPQGEPSAAMIMPMMGPLSSDPRTPPDSSRAKEALARMVNSRMQASGKVLESPEMGMPPIRPPLLPMMPQMPPQPQSPGRASPRTLRNITNNVEVQRSPQKSPQRSPPAAQLANRQATSARITQIVNSLSNRPTGLLPVRSALTNQLQAKQRPMEAPILYYGHDPVETVPEDLCLLGCVLYITDYHKYLKPEQIETWKKVIEQHGGQVDPAYSNRVTHLLCEHQRSDVFNIALRDHKRVVSAHWLNDVLVRKRMTPPWLALHFPSLYSEQKPCTNQIICVSGFEAEERTRLKHMIGTIGAKYTGYLTRANSVLICKKQSGTKYEKAREWRIPIVNVQWVNDVLFGHLEALKLPVHARYLHFGMDDDFKVEVSKVQHLMEGWRAPLRIPRDAWKKFGPSHFLQSQANKRKAENADQQPPAKRTRSSVDPSMKPNMDGRPCVLITGIPKGMAEDMAIQVEDLGGQVLTSAAGCTHLVVTSITRTVKLLTGLSVCKHIVTPEWISQSAKENRFVDEELFALKDKKAEAEYNFTLQESLRRAKERKVFRDLTFYITPGVIPGTATLTEIIQNAGGTVVKRRPAVRTLLTKKNDQGQWTFVVITCDDDLHLVRDMKMKKLPVFNAEFVISGVMRQEVDYESFVIS